MIAPDDLGHIDTTMMTMALGYEIKSRGTDATGVYLCDAKGRWKVRKNPYPADVFLAYRNGIGLNAKTLMIHTRAATQGKASNPLNNHPVIHGGIVGIHNGIVWNDDQLFKHYDWPRFAQVDSEAIFAAINYLDQQEALENIDGSWAIAYADTDDDPRKLWMCRGSSSPLHYAISPNGTVVFASTHSAIIEAFSYGGLAKPDVTMAKEGFLASISPDGGIEVREGIDTSGKTAVGARANRGAYVSSGAIAYYGGTSWETDEEWRGYSMGSAYPPKKDPRPYERVQVTGDKDHPKIGDRRKYLHGDDYWCWEICESVQPEHWKPYMAVATPADLHKQKQEEAKREELERLPFVASMEITDDDRYGWAGEGDLISIDKSLFDPGASGVICGEVLEKDGPDLIVQFRQARIHRSAEYEILMKKGEV